jgi:membrane-anchored protein YejM (alkaline phosphatase superfamily)
MLETLRKGGVFSRSYVDYMIGELVEETKTLKLYNDTTIVFWTDHGYKLGEHCDWFKHDNVRRLHEPHPDVLLLTRRCQYIPKY